MSTTTQMRPDLEPKTVWETIRNHALARPESTAIEAPSRDALTYHELWQHIQRQVVTLNALGLGRGDRVGIVLRNGPEMGSAFLAVSACACAAPLNPTYTAKEFEFYLSDIDARALIVEDGFDSPAVHVAHELGIRVLRLIVSSNLPAGAFTLQPDSEHDPEEPVARPGDRRLARDRMGFAAPQDIALILHTSGTTSRPKMVPLLHANVLASARNIGGTLGLTASDRCLNVMPLFHIHGLMAALSASVVSGAGVICTPGFFVTDFFDWMRRHEPTWYTAVPTMHQSILTRAGRHADVIRQHPLRFVRSSSASLPPRVLHDLERTFQAPVVEAYGMTEATHQMSSNPLPPGERKVKSVGPPAGPDIAIMDPNGDLLPIGETGEIVIRGETVTPGYLDNPDANMRAFENGWFRTGDEGYLDKDGYLFITGRLKELINRGGEKISPREIDEVLMDHPAVAQAVAFAIPDVRLGEDVGAAVVCRPGEHVTEQQLRAFASTRLSAFKLPRTLVFLDEIPKGPTGKLQRIGLAGKLGLDREADTDGARGKPHAAPRTPVEEYLCDLWADVLVVDAVGIEDRFLDLGGDSMLATRLVARIVDELAIEISIADLLDAPTIAKQAGILEERLLESDATDASGRYDQSHPKTSVAN